MRIAVVATGWHFPADFYKRMEAQILPIGWKADFYCIAHRKPEEARDKDISQLGDSLRERMDKVLYKKIADRKDLENWHLKLYPNTIGDWGCSNQWLDDYDYRKYDLILFTHDDNLIIRNDFLKYAIKNQKGWMILANSTGAPKGWLRGSCEFFKREMLMKMGGRFDLSQTTLTREGKTDNPEGVGALNDWNTTVVPLMEFIEKHDIPLGFISEYYRVSPYCVEGERGFIHYTHGQNTAEEEAGFKKYFK